MTNSLIAFIARLLAIPPLVLIFCSVFRTYWDKLHYINGLRKTRVTLMVLFFAMIVDNVVFMFYSLQSYLTNTPLTLSQPILILDKLSILSGVYGLYYLFRHASKKD